MSTFRIGDVVWYRGGWGNQHAVLCKVTGHGRKNGKTVIDNDLGHWGYVSQYQHADDYERAAEDASRITDAREGFES